MKYKLFDQQRQEYKTDYDYNDMVYDDLEEVKNDLCNYHSIDYGGLEEEEFNQLSLNGMLELFDWEIHAMNNNQSPFTVPNKYKTNN